MHASSRSGIGIQIPLPFSFEHQDQGIFFLPSAGPRALLTDTPQVRALQATQSTSSPIRVKDRCPLHSQRGYSQHALTRPR